MKATHASARAICKVLALALALAACASHARSSSLGPPPALPEPRRAARFVPLPEWYWEPVEVGVHATPKVVDLPIAEPSLVRVEGATRIWDELGAAGRERLMRDGLVVVGSADAAQRTKTLPARTRMGAFYMEAREQRVPYVVTLDALVHAVHVAFERALAEVDESVLAPELDTLILKLEARLSAEQRGAGVEVSEALQLARGIVAVARGLASNGAVPPPADLGPAIAQEITRVVAHSGPAPSALLGVSIDYGSFVVPSGAARPGSFRALAWLGSAPLVLVAQSEAPGAPVGVATSRLHARTAMLLARVSERDVDPGIYAAWSRISRLLAFVWGPSDDLSPPELVEMAAAIDVRVEDPKHVANVIAVDRLRRRAARGRAPLLFDGAGSPGRAGIAMRVFGGHAPADSVALASFARAHEGGAPQVLDLAVWLGAPEARASLHEAGGDALAGYDDALARAIAGRPSDDAPSRHASVYGSLLDALMIWLAPRAHAARPLASPAAQRATIESALAAWTYARHIGRPLSRARPSRSAHAPTELQVSGAALPAFVEAAPDVIARLVATVAQMKRGLRAIAELPATSPAMVTLAEVDDILRVAMRVASRSANDDALPTEDLAALASLPARLARLEEPGEDGVVPMVPVVAEVFTDTAGNRVLTSAAGVIEPAVMIVREPGTGRFVVAVGAHVAHHELLEPRTPKRSTDTTYREGGDRSAAPRAGYTAAFRMVR
jgi:hypothetical protein